MWYYNNYIANYLNTSGNYAQFLQLQQPNPQQVTYFYTEPLCQTRFHTKASSKQNKWKTAVSFMNNTTINSSNKSKLYPKVSIKDPKHQNVSVSQLYEKYLNQKKAENDFYMLKTQIDNVENLITSNPAYYTAFYVEWLKSAYQLLKQYTSIIESPDAVSFSSVYGYEKDEELITIYRHPIFQNELNKVGYYLTNNNQIAFWTMNNQGYPNGF